MGYGLKAVAVTSGGGGGAVSSVSNSDGTLTISPTTGAVVASLNLANANTWTATQTITPSSTASNALVTPAVTIGPAVLTGTSTTSNFLNVTGTLPTTTTAATQGVLIDVTAAGTSLNIQNAFAVQLLNGYTGLAQTSGISFQNQTAGTGTNAFYGTNQGNYGAIGEASATTIGTNIGLFGGARTGNINYGIMGAATFTKNNATNIGAAFFAANAGTTPTVVGLYVGLNTSLPAYTSAAFIADNANSGLTVARFRVNATTQVLINSTGQVGIGPGISTFGTVNLLTVGVNNTADNAAILQVNSSAVGNKVAVFQNFAAQTANNTEWQNSSGTPYVFVGPDTLSGASLTSNFFNITGTLPAVTTQSAIGASCQITTAGSAAHAQVGQEIDLLTGYTGANLTIGLNVTNAANSTGTGLLASSSGNVAIRGIMQNTGTQNAGGFFLGAAGGTLNIGVVAIATGNHGGATNIGVFGSATNNSPGGMAGVYATLGGTQPTVVAALIANNFTNTNPIAIFQVNNVNSMVIGSTGLISTYQGIATAGWGITTVYANSRSTAQTAAVASVATYTVGAADGSFYVAANVNVTAIATASFTVTCTYTDETSTSRTATLTFSQLNGTLLTAITNVTGTGPYEGVGLKIRAKASTAITIATTGTFTSVTYNVEGEIIQSA